MTAFHKAASSEPSDQQITELLRTAHTIAVVGLSSNRSRASYGVSQYMQSAGYRIIPVNPNEARGIRRKGLRAAGGCSGKDRPGGHVFRRSEFVPEIVDAAIRMGARAIWMQEGVADEACRATRARCRAASCRWTSAS